MMHRREQKFLKQALELAKTSPLRHRHGAIVVKSGKVVGRGVNTPRNHPGIIESGRHSEECAYHAEVVAMRDAGDNVKGSIIFVARVNNDGEGLLSKPCERCQKAIINGRVKKVVYTK